MTQPELISIDLTDDERDFMLGVLSEFGGPASYNLSRSRSWGYRPPTNSTSC
ncbi:hypothetical protein [Mycobacterium riyadhense]|uniref:Uncharacterized protein n=1 Tax=Mycobacterium riyadhense TaxID=486698 RepID=A0A653EYP7_9MYCO|nr:hypothetical protein [Mycobacterium riyadhense]VTP02617.1 hypothetical protein BIN_B_04603 [Mycobacterium riyadhense]